MLAHSKLTLAIPFWFNPHNTPSCKLIHRSITKSHPNSFRPPDKAKRGKLRETQPMKQNPDPKKQTKSPNHQQSLTLSRNEQSRETKITRPIVGIRSIDPVDYLRILLPWPTWYMPQEKAPKAAKKMAVALGPVLGMRRAYRTGANPPGGGPSWRTGMSFTLAMPGFFLIIASVIVARPCGLPANRRAIDGRIALTLLQWPVREREKGREEL